MDNLIHIQQVIKDLKNPKDINVIQRIPVFQNQKAVAFLRPVISELKEFTAHDAQLMAEWRNFYKTAFFTWITPTRESTIKWHANNYAQNMGDIIFMIETPNQVPLGHVSLYNFQSNNSHCEFGRILRNPSPNITLNGIMTLGSLTLLHWAASTLRVKQFFLEVFHDNKKAISLYKRLGFKSTATFPLTKNNINGDIYWEKIQNKLTSIIEPNSYGIKMELSATQLLKASKDKIIIRK